MCVVTWIPNLDGQCILTSNRDISTNRPHSNPPKKFTLNSTILLYPIDPVGKGSWIAASKDSIVCLLNAQSAKTQKIFSSSRGGLVLDLCVNSSSFLNNVNLNQFEAFQLVKMKYANKSLEHILWDGSVLKKTVFNWAEPCLWASNTLYSKNCIQEKKNRFDKLISRNDITIKTIQDFHRGESIEKEKKVINPQGQTVKTTSITMLKMNSDLVDMSYIDLVNQTSNRLVI